jgi:hypothetical protein
MVNGFRERRTTMLRQKVERYELSVSNPECEKLNFIREYESEEEALNAYDIASGISGCKVKLYKTSYTRILHSEFAGVHYAEERKLIKSNN